MASKTLEELYNEAAGDSYVGRVRQQQAADAGTADTGTNFFDGVGRDQQNNAPDEYQDEFSRNTAGDYRYGGGGKVPGTEGTTLSRWLSKGIAKAFGDVDGNTNENNYFTSPRFNPNYQDISGELVKVHRYAPLADRDFKSNLADLSRGRVTGAASGPKP